MRRWSPGFQQNVWASRVNTTKSLAQAIIDAKKKPEVFVCMSGVGFYSPSQTQEYTEFSEGGEGDFFAKLCNAWEGASVLPTDVNVRRAVIRSGVVLGREGGMIAQIFWPFFAGLGGKMGSGDQFFPWIHVEDLTRLILHTIMKGDCEGVYNGVAPQVVRNSEFAQAFAKALWRPALFPLPEFVLNAVFNPDRAKMITQGQKGVERKYTVCETMASNRLDAENGFMGDLHRTKPLEVQKRTALGGLGGANHNRRVQPLRQAKKAVDGFVQDENSYTAKSLASHDKIAGRFKIYEEDTQLTQIKERPKMGLGAKVQSSTTTTTFKGVLSQASMQTSVASTSSQQAFKIFVDPQESQIPTKTAFDKENVKPAFTVFDDSEESTTSTSGKASFMKCPSSTSLLTIKSLDQDESSTSSVANLSNFSLSSDSKHPTFVFQPHSDHSSEEHFKVKLTEAESPIAMDISIIDESKDSKILVPTSHSNRHDFPFPEEYMADLHRYLRTSELRFRPKPNYMRKQPDITPAMRSILVDWLVEVAEEYKLNGETLFLAVSYIDRFLSHMSVLRGKLQLVGTAAMFIASKFEEIYPPELGEFVYITDDTYTKKQVLRMEHLILKVLTFDLSVPTPLYFLNRYCQVLKADRTTLYLATYLCELTLLECDPYLKYLPSEIAASALALAQATLGEKSWNSELEQMTNYRLVHFAECLESLHNTFTNASSFAQQSIREKYKLPKFNSVALHTPPPLDALNLPKNS
nr:EOG090X07KR [Triops cancriformis]